MFCTNCGKEIPDDSQFCTFCGNPIDRQAGAEGPVSAADVTQEMPYAGGMPVDAAGRPAVGQPAPAKPRSKAPFIVAGVAAAAIVAGIVAFVVVPAVQGSSQPQQASEQSQASGKEEQASAQATASKVAISVSDFDASLLPTVSVNIKVADESGMPVENLTPSDFKVSEKVSGTAYAGKNLSLGSNGNGSYKLSFDSGAPATSTDSRSVTLTSASDERAWEPVGFSYSPQSQQVSGSNSSAQPTSVDDHKVNAVDTADYVLPNSDKVYYSTSDFSGLSDWELYVARNEIYARHGRKFKNDDLARYFSRKSWYTPIYSPDEFDAKPDMLNDYEKKNADTLLAYEKNIGSQYVKN